MRRIRLILIGAAVVVASSASHVRAQSAPSASPKDQENAVNVLRQQRNEQADLVATLAVRTAALERELAEAKEKLATCKPKAEEKK